MDSDDCMCAAGAWHACGCATATRTAEVAGGGPVVRVRVVLVQVLGLGLVPLRARRSVPAHLIMTQFSRTASQGRARPAPL